MYGAGLEVEFQTAALDKTQCDDDFLVGRESGAGEIFLQFDGEDDLRTVDDLAQVVLVEPRLADLGRLRWVRHVMSNSGPPWA